MARSKCCIVLLVALCGCAAAVEVAVAPAPAVVQADGPAPYAITYDDGMWKNGPCPFSPVEEAKSCGWIASCGHEAECSDKCVPHRKSHHDGFGSLLAIKSMVATKCSTMAQMIKGLNSGMPGTGRKMLGTDHADQEATLRKVARKLVERAEFVKSSFGTLKTVRKDETELAVTNFRSLSEVSDEVGMACPTQKEVETVAPIMGMMRKFMSGDTSDNAGDNASPAEEAMGGIVMAILGEYLDSPEKMKTMFTDECFTDTVTEEPLLSIYRSMSMGGGSFEDDDMGMAPSPETPPPESVVACRPTGKDDLEIIASTAKMALACESAAEEVTLGKCMAYEVADLLDTECFDAGANFLDLGTDRTRVMKDSMLAVYNTCKEASSKSTCETISMTDEEAHIAKALEGAQDDAIGAVHSASPPPVAAKPASKAASGSNHGAKSGAIAVAMVLIAVLFGLF